MRKAELVAEVQKAYGGNISKQAARRIVGAVLDGMKKGLRRDKVVRLVGFGTFSVVSRAARVGVNPQTGERIKVRASIAIKFKASPALKPTDGNGGDN